jgi:hypothetical protein
MKRVTLLIAKLSITLSLVLLPIASLTGVALADNPLGKVCNDQYKGQHQITAGDPTQSAYCKDVPTTNPLYGPTGIISTITNIISIIAGIAAVIVIIIAGLQFVTSGGDPQRVEKAKNAIIFSVIGLIIIVIARFIIEFVVSSIG